MGRSGRMETGGDLRWSGEGGCDKTAETATWRRAKWRRRGMKRCVRNETQKAMARGWGGRTEGWERRGGSVVRRGSVR